MKATGLDIRPYREEDEAEVLAVLTASLGGGPAGVRPPEFFRWKHLESPFGPSLMLVAEIDGRIAGLRAFMRWRFSARDRVFEAVRAVDTATHPDFQGKGVFAKLTLRALEDLRAEGVAFVFNTPNPASLQGYLKMGWRIVGRIPVSIRVRKPIRFARGRMGTREPGARPPVDAPTASETLADAPPLEELLSRAGIDERLHTPRDVPYLRWRYADAPLLDYRAICEEEAGRARGLIVFRVRPRGGLWETTIAELIVEPGDVPTARRLLQRARKAAPVHHLASHFAPGSEGAAVALRSGYVRAPGGMTFVANPLGERVEPDPTDLGSWALAIGDVEVF